MSFSLGRVGMKANTWICFRRFVWREREGKIVHPQSQPSNHSRAMIPCCGCLDDRDAKIMEVPSMLWMHNYLPVGQLSSFEQLVLSSLHVPYPPEELERLTTLHQILSSPVNSHANDHALQSIVSLACRHYHVPIAAVTLVDVDSVFSMTSYGMEAFRVHRNHSLCSHTILTDDVSIILDASKDERVLDAPLVRCEGGIRFYAGAAIHVSGQRVGALCIISPIARSEFSEADRECLMDMAGMVSDILSERRKGYMDVVNVYEDLRQVVTDSLQPYLHSLDMCAFQLQDVLASIANDFQEWGVGMTHTTGSTSCKLDEEQQETEGAAIRKSGGRNHTESYTDAKMSAQYHNLAYRLPLRECLEVNEVVLYGEIFIYISFVCCWHLHLYMSYDFTLH